MRRILFCMFLVVTPSLAARVYAPRVVSEHTADAYSMTTFAAFPGWRDLEGDAKAWAIFAYLTDSRTGLAPMGAGAWEGEVDFYEYGLVRDPVKMINVYCNAYCDVLGPVMAGIWHDMGLGPSRTVNLPAWSHVASEVFYGGRWHYLDLDVRAAFRRPDGTLASLEEARRDPSLWADRGPRFFPMDDPARVEQIYRQTDVQIRHAVHTGGHTMDYLLRGGERFTRWWTPQGGRWLHHASYNRPHPRNLLEKDPPGPKAKHASFTVHTSGNGQFVYAPNLSDQSLDFEDGVYDASNIRPGPEGLTLENPGRGTAIFEVRSPYVIVPIVGNMETTDDDRDASVIEVDATSCTLALSLDGGLSWAPLGDVRGQAHLDATAHVAGTYGYLLKLELEGAPATAWIRSLSITTWVQLHPASLPGLRQGLNHLELRVGDHYGLPTRIFEIRPNTSIPQAFLKHLLAPPDDYDPARTTERIRGSFVVVVPAPPHTTIAWFSAGGGFRTHQGDAAPRTAHRMAYAVEKPQDFHEFYRAQVPVGNAHWHMNADREVKLDQPARTLFVRYTGDPAVNTVRIYAHCRDEKAFPPTAVRVTHVWEEGNTRRTKTITLSAAGPYTLETNQEPKEISITLEVPTISRTP